MNKLPKILFRPISVLADFFLLMVAAFLRLLRLIPGYRKLPLLAQKATAVVLSILILLSSISSTAKRQASLIFLYSPLFKHRADAAWFNDKPPGRWPVRAGGWSYRKAITVTVQKDNLKLFIESNVGQQADNQHQGKQYTSLNINVNNSLVSCNIAFGGHDMHYTPLDNPNAIKNAAIPNKIFSRNGNNLNLGVLTFRGTIIAAPTHPADRFTSKSDNPSKSFASTDIIIS